MPTYTATNDIFNVVSSKIVAELTDDAAGTTVDTTFVDSALDRAESVVDSYVGKQYTVPLSTPVLDSIAHAVLTLAKCYLYKRRPGAVPDEIKTDYDNIILWLTKIAKGKLELDQLTDTGDIAEQNNDAEVFKVQIF